MGNGKMIPFLRHALHALDPESRFSPRMTVVETDAAGIPRATARALGHLHMGLAEIDPPLADLHLVEGKLAAIQSAIEDEEYDQARSYANEIQRTLLPRAKNRTREVIQQAIDILSRSGDLGGEPAAAAGQLLEDLIGGPSNRSAER